jgi:hypothetical protein
MSTRSKQNVVTVRQMTKRDLAKARAARNRRLKAADKFRQLTKEKVFLEVDGDRYLAEKANSGFTHIERQPVSQREWIRVG